MELNRVETVANSPSVGAFDWQLIYKELQGNAFSVLLVFAIIAAWVNKTYGKKFESFLERFLELQNKVVITLDKAMDHLEKVELSNVRAQEDQVRAQTERAQVIETLGRIEAKVESLGQKP